ncbi:hypothetical protein ABZU91_32440, partial [Micromonospora sp. NPDC005174]
HTTTRLSGGCSMPTDKTTPPQQVRTDLLLEYYVHTLLERWIDMTEDEEDASPWSDGPMIGNASGPIIYFAMRYSMCEEVSAEAAKMAAEQGLICFDPQWDRLRPSDGGAVA